MTRDSNPEMVAELDRLDRAGTAASTADRTAQVALRRQVTALAHSSLVARDSGGRPTPPCGLGLVASEGGATPTFDEPGAVGVALDQPRLGHCVAQANPGPHRGWLEGAAR
jgi:hypothetical protein